MRFFIVIGGLAAPWMLVHLIRGEEAYDIAESPVRIVELVLLSIWCAAVSSIWLFI